MRNTTLATTLLAVSAAGLVAGLTGEILSGAADASRPPARAASNVHVLRFVDRVDATTNKDIDLGDKGFSVGDQQVFRDRLTRGGHQVGTAQGYGEITYLTKSQLGITGVATADLGKGTLALRFSAVESLATGPAPTSVSAVTGGTGTYAGATGQCTSTRIGEGDDARITCRVVLPR
jgi:hypothetical protein